MDYAVELSFLASDVPDKNAARAQVRRYLENASPEQYDGFIGCASVIETQSLLDIM